MTGEAGESGSEYCVANIEAKFNARGPRSMTTHAVGPTLVVELLQAFDEHLGPDMAAEPSGSVIRFEAFWETAVPRIAGRDDGGADCGISLQETSSQPPS